MLEQIRVQQRGLALPLAADQPVGEGGQHHGTEAHDQSHIAAALLPHEDAEDEATHADDGEDGAHGVDLARPGVGNVLDQANLGEHHQNDQCLEPEPHPPGQVRREKTPQERTDGGCDRRRGSDQCIRPLLGAPSEVAVDEGLHRRQQQGCTQSADDGPEDDDGIQILGQHHAHRTDGIGQ